MGEEKGMIDAQIASGLCGFSITWKFINRDIMMGSEIGRVKVCAECSSSDTEPTPAKSVE